jgi:uncharacterized protein YdeI (YjbR/CyaY-like superfamily)
MRFRATVELHGKTATGIVVPEEVIAALDAGSYTPRKEWVRWVEEAKKAETRQTRLTKTVESLREGKRTR